MGNLHQKENLAQLAQRWSVLVLLFGIASLLLFASLFFLFFFLCLSLVLSLTFFLELKCTGERLYLAYAVRSTI